MKNATKSALVAAALSTAALTSSAASPESKVPKPTVVLVHGAFADGSTWNKVIPLLQAKGLKVVAVQNPLPSLADDVAATRRAIRQVNGPVVLVGHSWGGVVITEAGQADNVKSLVYVAAFAPSEGQSITDISKGYPTPVGFSQIVADPDGFLTLTAEGVAKHLAQDVPAEQTSLMAAIQGPVRGKNFEEKVSAAAWRGRPVWYVLAEQDHMLQPDLQRAMAQTIHANVTVLSAGHAPQMSRPHEVAEVILQAAGWPATARP